MEKKFYVNEDCVSCGLCSMCCPVGAIEMIDGHPTWNKEKCIFCMNCKNNCPMTAIDFVDKE